MRGNQFMTDTTFEVEVEKKFDTEINFDQDTNIDINFDKDVNVDVDIKVDTDIDGNTAIFIFDAQALGKDTFVEVDATVIAIEDTLSHASGSIISTVG
jgi:hypothetical protein